jgi:hypothetical protein
MIVSRLQVLAFIVFTLPAFAADQTAAGAGNGLALSIASSSEIVQSARQYLISQAYSLQDATLKGITIDAITNPDTCVAHRANITEDRKTAILKQLSDAGLVNPADDKTFPNGLRAGVFPPLRDEGTSCPKLPQPFYSAPGSTFGGHHSYPGGLMVHESANELSSLNFAAYYRRVYGSTAPDGLPAVVATVPNAQVTTADIYLDQDIVVGAPIWHDWAKSIVFQWNADGTEFQELNFGGNTQTDNYGAAGDSTTGGHHIIGGAEAMKRGLSPAFIISQLSAHSAPTSGNEFKVVNWIRAAAILAQVDPVAQGYLYKDSMGRLRLPPLRQLGSIDLIKGSLGHTNTLTEYVLHNLSDSDFNMTGPAVTEIQTVLAAVASQFGYDPTATATYNNQFRNPVLSNLTAERLFAIYGNSGTAGVAAQITKIQSRQLVK